MISQQILFQKFSEKFSAPPDEAKIFFAPGRVCLIGEHIDYNGGLVLPAALSLGTYGVFKPDNSNMLRLRSSMSEEEVSIHLHQDVVFDETAGWANYPAGVIKYLKKRRFRIPGGELFFETDLPIGAGLSSSAAIEVLTGFIFFSYSTSRSLTRTQLAEMCKEVENNFIGVQCGIMDQFAVAMGKRNHAIKLNCNSLQYEHIPVALGKYALLIFNTNKKRELTDSLFNERVRECREALHDIRQHQTIEHLADADEKAVRAFVRNPLAQKRAMHVVQENKRVQLASDALKRGDIEQFGALLFQSHESLSTQYEVTGKELDSFFQSARKHPACIGAKMSGAGFGGCAFALVRADAQDDFISTVTASYYRETGISPAFYTVEIEDGVRKIS